VCWPKALRWREWRSSGIVDIRKFPEGLVQLVPMRLFLLPVELCEVGKISGREKRGGMACKKQFQRKYGQKKLYFALISALDAPSGSR